MTASSSEKAKVTLSSRTSETAGSDPAAGSALVESRWPGRLAWSADEPFMRAEISVTTTLGDDDGRTTVDDVVQGRLGTKDEVAEKVSVTEEIDDNPYENFPGGAKSYPRPVRT